MLELVVSNETAGESDKKPPKLECIERAHAITGWQYLGEASANSRIVSFGNSVFVVDPEKGLLEATPDGLKPIASYTQRFTVLADARSAFFTLHPHPSDLMSDW